MTLMNLLCRNDPLDRVPFGDRVVGVVVGKLRHCLDPIMHAL